MKIIIDDKPVYEAELDYKQFKEDFKETFDLDSSVKNNIKVTKINEDISESLIKQNILLYFDWNTLFMMKKVEDMIKIWMYPCEVEDRIKYLPYAVKKKELILEAHKFNGKEFIIKSNAIKHPSAIISNFLRMDTLRWVDGNKELKWSFLIE